MASIHPATGAESLPSPHRYRALLVGSGGNGIGVAIELAKAGVKNLKIITRHSDFGGVWHQNNYPGCYTDVPILAYQMECKIRTHWAASHASRAEMLDYLRDLALEHGLYNYTDFNTELLEAKWSTGDSCWDITTNNGNYLADFLLTATGYLDDPNIPIIPGIETFPGNVFHSSQWPEGYTGEEHTVAVVGTSSSAAQIIPPLRQVASKLVVLQRTATYVLPRNDKQVTDEERSVYEKDISSYMEKRSAMRAQYDVLWEELMLATNDAHPKKLEAEWHKNIEKLNLKPELRKLVTPTMAIGIRRPTMNDEYYTAINQDNVDFVAESLASVNGKKIMTSGGREFEVDAIVLATGFKFLGHTMDRIKRRDGTTITEHQQGHLRAYKAVTPAGCPNLFLIGGSSPNSTVWDGFYPAMVYPKYVVETMKFMDRHRIRAMEVTEDAEMAWKQNADEVIKQSPMSKDPKSYFLDPSGHNKATYPGSQQDMKKELSVFDPSAYSVVAWEKC